MSKIVKQPIKLESVELVLEDPIVSIKGPKGKMFLHLHTDVTIEVKNSQAMVKEKARTFGNKAILTTTRSLLNNAVIGVTKGWKKTLKLVGVGYRAQTNGNQLTLKVGFSHPVTIKAPEGITFQVKDDTITVSGIDKQMVGEITAQIRNVRPPEPYKGKGIRYIDEQIRRKAGKAAKAFGGS